MFPSIYKKLIKWREDSKFINILVTGKTGTGKSALINSIIGQEITKEGSTLKPETKSVEHTLKTVGEISLQVWDSPGLQDGTEKEPEYVHSIVEKCSTFDLIVYTMRMSQAKILKNGPDCRAMQILSQPTALGPNLWHNTIIVLTFANVSEQMTRYSVDGSSQTPIEIQRQEVFKDDFESAVSAIQAILIESVGLSRKLAESIPIVPAGYKTASATLPKYKYEIADGERLFWLSNLWIKALRVTKLDAQPAMIKLNEYRMAESEEEYEGRLNSSKAAIARQMPLIFGAKGAEIGKRMYSVFTGVGTGVGAVSGGGIGHILSYAILADQGSKNKILTEEEYREFCSKCQMQTKDLEDCFCIVPER